MYAMWLYLPARAFGERFQENFNHEQRFDSTAKRLQGQLHDLVEAIPPEYHGLFASHDMQKLVSSVILYAHA
jgi:hypothetical protein